MIKKLRKRMNMKMIKIIKIFDSFIKIIHHFGIKPCEKILR